MRDSRQKGVQARNAWFLDRVNIKIIKKIIQQLFAKYKQEIVKTNIGLPENDSFLYWGKKLINQIDFG